MPSFKLALLFFTVASLATTSNAQYEIWASDQSNSVSGESSTGVNGSYLWIWDAPSVKSQLNNQNDAVPLSCTPDATVGPCDLWDVFPPSLVETGSIGVTGNVLGDLPKFGRLHGMIKDPQARYVTANMYAPGKSMVIEIYV